MSKRLKSWGMLLFLSLIWGSSFILMKRGMIDKATGNLIFTNNQVGAMRMLFSSAALLPIGLRNIKIVSSFKIGFSLFIVALMGNFLPAFLFTYAETGISSGYAGMLNSATPIFTLIFGSLLFKDKLYRLQVLGVGLGTIGIIGLVNGVTVVDTSGTWFHVGAVVLATVCYSLSANTLHHNLSHLKALKVTSVAFSFSFVPALLLFFYFNTPQTILHHENAPNALIYILILALVGTALSVVIFNQLIKQTSALFASSVTYLIPIVAVVLGFIDGETISWIQVISMGVILSGIFVANGLTKKRSKINS